LAYHRGDFAGAAASYREAHVAEPENPWHLYAYAMSLRHAGQLAVSSEAIDAALTLSPQFPEALHEKAALECAMGDDTAARATLEKAIELSPSRAELHHTLSLVLTRLNCLDDAIVAARHAIEIDSYLVRPHIHLGFLYLGACQPDLAVREMAIATESAPEDADAWYGKSVALLAAGDVAEAKNALALALQIRPDEPKYNQQSQILGGY
jgi:tetratricopeptide (TPR) repeat protein